MYTILVVSDKEGIRESLKALLEDEHVVLTAQEGLHSLEVIREKPVDVVFLDFPLPDIEVADLLEKMGKDERPEVILIAPASDLERRQGYGDLEVFDWLEKPFHREEVNSLVKKALERKRLLREVKTLRSIIQERKELGSSPSSSPASESSPSYYSHEVIRRFSRALSRVQDMKVLLDEVLSAVMDTFEVSKVSILLQKKEGGEFRVEASLGIDKKFLQSLRFKPGEGLVAWLVREGRMLRWEEVLENEHREEFQRLKREMELIQCRYAIPLLAQGRLKGALALGNKATGESFSPPELRLLFTMANYIALSIETALLYQEISFQKNYQKNLLDSMTSGVIAIDREGVVTIVNRAAERILGLKVSELRGKSIQLAGSKLADIMLRTLEGEREYRRHEIVYPGTNIPLGISTSLLREEGASEPIGALMIFQDLTEVKNLERRVLELEREGFWRRLASGMAHEIRNPLVSIKTFTQLLPDKYKDDNFRKKFYQVVIREVDRLDNLIERLEKFAQPASCDFHKVDLHSLLEEILFEYEELFERQKIKVNRKYASELLFLYMDRERLKEAFSNFLDNSLQAMPEGGELTITTILTDENGGEVIVEFTDTGEGISPQNIEKLSSPFFSSRGKGVGLGIPIARKIIEAHKGRLEFRSRLKKGTTVSITFKIQEEETLEEEELKEREVQN